MDELTPASAWQRLVDGNARFVGGESQHPNGDAARRQELTGGQHPFAVVFGCGDSRAAAEILFDQGLGDLFVVRNAGHVVDPGALGSIEFGVELLQTPVIVVLGHESCGAVGATLAAAQTGELPPGFIRDIVERVMPSAVAARIKAGDAEVGSKEVVSEHVMQTARLLVDRSKIVADALAAGRLAIVGATYQLSSGKVEIDGVLGSI